MVGLHLYEISKIVKFLKTESTVVVTRGWGRGKESSLVSVEFQLGMTRKFWRGMVVRAAHLCKLHLMSLHFIL